MASKSRETEIALQKLEYTETQADEIERLRNINEDVVVELASAIWSGYKSELARLRKIEAAARAVCEAIPAWAEELLEIHPLAPLRKLVETNDD